MTWWHLAVQFGSFPPESWWERLQGYRRVSYNQNFVQRQRGALVGLLSVLRFNILKE